MTGGPGLLPLADAVVTLVDEDGQVVARTTTGDDGAYRFADLPDGDFVVTASNRAPTTSRGSLQGGHVHGTDVHLGDGALGAGMPARA